jgi:hypothetical protein
MKKMAAAFGVTMLLTACAGMSDTQQRALTGREWARPAVR